MPGQDELGRRITITDAEGHVSTGMLKQIGGGMLSLEGAAPREFATAQLVLAEWTARPVRSLAADPVLLLADGDRLVAFPLAMNEEFLSGQWVRFPAWPTVKLPLEAVRGAVLPMPLNPAARAAAVSRISDRRDPHDLVVLNNGDTATGELKSLDEREFTLQTPVGPTKIGRAGVRAFGLNPELTSPRRRDATSVIVTLTDGSRFHATHLKTGVLEKLQMKPEFGGDLEVPLSAVAALQFLGGQAVYLSDLPPDNYEFHPFLGVHWPLRADRTVAGGPLALRGKEYARGLGMHSQSAATWRLDQKYRRFQATIGVDDDADGRGSVEFEVLVDGVKVYSSPVLTGASPPVVLEPITVRGAKLLTLRVGFATFGDVQDHADWCNALLVK